MIVDLLYLIFIQPIEWAMELIYSYAFAVIGSYGLAIIFLSLFVNIVLLPVYFVSDKLMDEERSIQKKMASKQSEIKLAFVGQERFMMTRMLYKINGYHPAMALRSSAGLLVQIPFFIAAYHLLSEYEGHIGVSFLFIADLSEPDGFIKFFGHEFNVMPLIMTIINLLSAYVYAGNLSKKEKLQIYLIATIFLVALYTMPVGVVFYWTINNVFSLFKNLIYKNYSEHITNIFDSTKIAQRLKNIISDSLIIYFGMIGTFIFVPLFMINNNPEDFKFLNATVFYKMALLLSIVSAILFSCINIILRLLQLNNLSRFYIYFLLVFLVFSGFLFPLSISSILVSPEKTAVNYLNLAIVFIAAIGLSIATLNSFKRYVDLFLIVVVFTSVGSTLLSISGNSNLKLAAYQDDYKSDDKLSKEALSQSNLFSNKKNIFVISFDGMSGDMVNSLIRTNPTYTNFFKDFVVYTNAVNQAPSTRTSLLGDIYGIQDYKSIAPTYFELKRKLLTSSLFENSPANKIADTYQHGYEGYGIKDYGLAGTSSVETFNFFKYPFVRLFTSHGLNFIGWHRLERFQKSVGVDTQSRLSQILNEIEKGGIHNWTEGVTDFYNFNLFLSSADTSDAEMSLRYLHFNFTHTPVIFDQNCVYKGDDQEWFNRNQNSEGLLKQQSCGLIKFSHFIETLKQLGIYDKSLIILKSDHGIGASYFSEYPDNLIINGNKEWGYNRYKSVLMIKDFESIAEKAIFKSNLVLQNDIAKTVCLKASTLSDCTQFNGIDLFSDKSFDDESYYLYVPTSSESAFWLFKNLRSVKVSSRADTLLEVMKNSDFITLTNNANYSE